MSDSVLIKSFSHIVARTTYIREETQRLIYPYNNQTNRNRQPVSCVGSLFPINNFLKPF